MSLVKLSDVIIQAPQSGDVLIYDSTTSGTGAWINKPLQSIIEDATVVDVENIKGLSEWLQSHAGNTPGLSEQNFTQDLYIKLSDSLFISSVDNFNFKVVAGELKINTINQSQVANLEQILNSKASINDIAVIDSKVQDLNNILNGYTPEGSQEPVLGLRAVISNVQVNVQNNTEAIEVLNQHLTWQDLK